MYLAVQVIASDFWGSFSTVPASNDDQEVVKWLREEHSSMVAQRRAHLLAFIAGTSTNTVL